MRSKEARVQPNAGDPLNRLDPLQKSFKLTGLLSRHREQMQCTADQAADHRPVHSYVLQVSADGRLAPVGEAAWVPAAHDSSNEADQLGPPRQRLSNNGLDGRVQPLAYRGVRAQSLAKRGDHYGDGAAQLWRR